jgi:ATP phosphoribosyltransferase regulatory subunit
MFIFHFVFERAYERVITPVFEYAESLTHAFGPGLKESSIQFMGPSGKDLILRPDHTAAIARIVASRYQKEDMPVQLYYLDSIFRNYEEQGEKEFFQAGVECIGGEGPEVDASVIMTCIEVLLKLGITDFGIDIGHFYFLDQYTQSQRDALLAGDYIAFGGIPKRGGIELAQDCEALQLLYECLKSENMHHYVHFNTGLIRPFGYYTGMIFECYLKDYGRSIGSGGRYDRLLSKFGLDVPAVGFALKANQLMRIVHGA